MMKNSKLKILIVGAKGKMGCVTVAAIEQQQDMLCVGAIGHHDNIEASIQETVPDIAIDFTIPSEVFKNCSLFIKHNVRPVIGTSGLTVTQVQSLQEECQKKKLGGIIAPNFSLGAILMMKYAKDAARYFSDVEIIEMHHPFKLDAPSGTAYKTAHMIAEQRKIGKTKAMSMSTPNQKLNEKVAARGDQVEGIPIHSVRLPGLFAHQAVIFGGTGELLTIRHDGMDRKSCMPGVIMACRKVMSLENLIYGLENVID